MRYLIWLAGIACLISCGGIERPQAELPNVDFENADVLRILTAQDKRLTDSLLVYFQSADANHRYLAARAFASVQDKKATPALVTLLSDSNLDVKKMAAYAIGQTRDTSAAIALQQAFTPTDTVPKIMEVNRYILEAIGKCGDAQMLRNISSVRNYGPEDTLMVQGQMRSIYQFGLRGMTDSIGTRRAMDILENDQFDSTSRLLAVNYLYRNRSLNLAIYTSRLVSAYIKEKDDETKRFLAVVLGRTNSEPALNQLLGDLRSERTSPELKCNILRSLNGYEYEQINKAVLPLLQSPNDQVVSTLVSLLKSKAKAYDANFFWNMAKADTTRKVTRSLLYDVTNTVMPPGRQISKGRVNNEIIKALDGSLDPYIRSNYMSALGAFGWNYSIIGQKTLEATDPIVKTAGTRTLCNIYRGADTNRSFNTGRITVKRNIAKLLSQIIQQKDIGAITEAAILLQESDDISRYFRDTAAISSAIEALDLPRDFEAYQSLVKASENLGFDIIDQPLEAPGYNHPIDFQRINALTDSSTAIIDTDKGRISLALYRNHAPGSVDNFVALAASGYFKEKNFHRVVPNFVIQGGCTRGDGYGIADYSIRSEFSNLSYDGPGYIGMASSGRDTEGTQFFITHTAALHLDGRYTIFGRVIEGMDVVNSINVGDKIQDVQILF